MSGPSSPAVYSPSTNPQPSSWADLPDELPDLDDTIAEFKQSASSWESSWPSEDNDDEDEDYEANHDLGEHLAELWQKLKDVNLRPRTFYYRDVEDSDNDGSEFEGDSIPGLTDEDDSGPETDTDSEFLQDHVPHDH
ncbi:hypothetical protein H0H81_002598 [Sphagnurus paluster]|uniref:Uncharacterized protein n=1 Tax=Sphagnurus paluster TaxID=117069 RepID=A0A9P7FRX6_9AGAR|nr:hypothetical protein H0H81_002598 [Sphagnurus paluster]